MLLYGFEYALETSSVLDREEETNDAAEAIDQSFLERTSVNENGVDLEMTAEEVD